MQVEATRLGYYGLRRRREGDTFRLSSPKHFSESWMRALGEESKPARGKANAAAPPEPEDDGSQSDADVI